MEPRPLTTSLESNVVFHDLAPEGAEMLAGTFVPKDSQVIVDVQAAYSILGMSRAALLLYYGQPETPGSRLYDAGGMPVDDAQWWSVGSVNGESAWASTTQRRLVLDVEAGKPVTWQILGGIIGGASTVPIAGTPHHIAITPDGAKAFVTAPDAGTVTPIALGRPGYSFDASRTVSDTKLGPIYVGGAPTFIAASNAHVVVSTEDCIVVLATDTHDVLHRVPLDSPSKPTLTADGSVVVGVNGGVARAHIGPALRDGDETARIDIHAVDGRVTGVALSGDEVFAVTQEGCAYVINLLSVRATSTIEVGDNPTAVQTAPDGQIWVLCRDRSRIKRIDPVSRTVFEDWALRWPAPLDFAIVPTAEQTDTTVRTAWVVFEGGHYSQMHIGGSFAGVAHTIHAGAFEGETPGVAVNDFGEIWVVQAGLQRVWKWPGGRILCRADRSSYNGVFFGEYLDVMVYGART